MNKRQTRPSSSTSSSSKKSLTDSAGHINMDSSSLINCSSSNVSIYQRGNTASVSGTAGNSSRRATNQRSDQQTGGSLSAHSENNIRKSNTSVQSATTKERKNHERISLRNFISRTLFSATSSASSSNTKTRSNSSPSSDKMKKDRKGSSCTSPPNALQTQTSSGGLGGLSVTTPISEGRRPSLVGSCSTAGGGDQGEKQCSVCYGVFPKSEFPILNKNMRCSHVACLACFRQYLTVQITESRVDLTCPECDAPLHPNDMQAIMDDPLITLKYEQFMIRRVLAGDVDTRWCPAPDCGYAVIAAGCAECPRLVCEREECGTAFCYHCAGVWHPVSTCDEARAQRFSSSMGGASGGLGVGGLGGVTFRRTTGNALFSAAPSSLLGKIKPCPRCRALIAKMDDGSCNHMTCTICGADFCWLCMKEISDLHFLSPTGCTFWGKKPWSRKKKLICQLGTLIGAPVGIALVAGVAIPSMIIGIPIWVGRKIHRKMIFSRPFKRNMAVVSGVTGAILLSPAVAALVVGFGVPLMLAYVYGVVPFSLCRNGGTCRSNPNATNSVANSNSNLSSEDVVIGGGVLDEDNLQVGDGGAGAEGGDGGGGGGGDCSKSPDEQLMLRMMMVLDEKEEEGQGGRGSEGGLGGRGKVRHQAEINQISQGGQGAGQQVEQTASIGEFSMDSCDVHSQRKLVLLDPSGNSITDADAVRLTEERDEAVARIRINDEDKSNFDSASTLAFHLSARRQSASSGSVNCSLGDRLTLETMSTDMDDIGGGDIKDSLDVAEQDNASTKALAGSILGNRDHHRRVEPLFLDPALDPVLDPALDLSPSSLQGVTLAVETGRQDSIRSLDTSSEIV